VTGYTLLELVVTITVATILAAIAIPFFSQTNVEASWFNEQARAAVRYAQRQAVAQRRSVYVDVSSTQIRLCYDSGCTSPVSRFGSEIYTPGATPTPAAGMNYTLTVPAGVTVTPTSFSFNGLGQPVNSLGNIVSAGTIAFTAGSTITITGETGLVQ